MTKAPPRPSVDLPIDVVDAAGLFGAFAGLLSLVLPYFAGLSVALGATLVGVGLIRASQGPFGPHGRRTDRGLVVVAFGVAAAAWVLAGLVGAVGSHVGPAVLGVGGLPLWWVARRPVPFGGGAA